MSPCPQWEHQEFPSASSARLCHLCRMLSWLGGHVVMYLASTSTQHQPNHNPNLNPTPNPTSTPTPTQPLPTGQHQHQPKPQHGRLKLELCWNVPIQVNHWEHYENLWDTSRMFTGWEQHGAGNYILKEIYLWMQCIWGWTLWGYAKGDWHMISSNI